MQTNTRMQEITFNKMLKATWLTLNTIAITLIKSNSLYQILTIFSLVKILPQYMAPHYPITLIIIKQV